MHLFECTDNYRQLVQMKQAHIDNKKKLEEERERKEIEDRYKQYKQREKVLKH